MGAPEAIQGRKIATPFGGIPVEYLNLLAQAKFVMNWYGKRERLIFVPEAVDRALSDGEFRDWETTRDGLFSVPRPLPKELSDNPLARNALIHAYLLDDSALEFVFYGTWGFDYPMVSRCMGEMQRYGSYKEWGEGRRGPHPRDVKMTPELVNGYCDEFNIHDETRHLLLCVTGADAGVIS